MNKSIAGEFWKFTVFIFHERTMESFAHFRNRFTSVLILLCGKSGGVCFLPNANIQKNSC